MFRYLGQNVILSSLNNSVEELNASFKIVLHPFYRGSRLNNFEEGRVITQCLQE